jgi:prepilin-type N-terminal cleavage/methylation domain-containing protein
VHTDRRVAFTLIELLAVVAIIGLLGLATVASYQAIAQDVRRAGAVEQVKSMLAKARMQALLGGRSTGLVFRPVVTAPGVQQIEGVLVEYAGDARPYVLEDPLNGLQSKPMVARFVPVKNSSPMRMARGIGIASPGHRLSHTTDDGGVRLPLDADKQFFAVSQLAATLPEAPGQLIGVLFARDGSHTTIMHESDADWMWVDWNGDGAQRYDGVDYCNRPDVGGFNAAPPCPPEVADAQPWSPPAGDCWLGVRYLANGNASPAADLWNDDERVPLCMRNEDDESYVLIAPYLVIYDDRDVHEEVDTAGWLDSGSDAQRRQAAVRRALALNDFIDKTGRQVHLNRVTGVAQEGRTQ